MFAMSSEFPRRCDLDKFVSNCNVIELFVLNPSKDTGMQFSFYFILPVKYSCDKPEVLARRLGLTCPDLLTVPPQSLFGLVKRHAFHILTPTSNIADLSDSLYYCKRDSEGHLLDLGALYYRATHTRTVVTKLPTPRIAHFIVKFPEPMRIPLVIAVKRACNISRDTL